MVRGKDKPPTPLAAIEAMQAKLVEECNRRARELNLKVRGLPSTSPLSGSPMEVGARFFWDTLSLPDIALDMTWLGTSDWFHALKAKQKLFSLSNKNFLDEDLSRAQVVALKQSKEQVMAARQARKWAVIKNLQAAIWDSYPPRWEP